MGVGDTGTEDLPVSRGVVQLARPDDDDGARVCAIELVLWDESGREVDPEGIGLVLRVPVG